MSPTSIVMVMPKIFPTPGKLASLVNEIALFASVRLRYGSSPELHSVFPPPPVYPCPDPSRKAWAQKDHKLTVWYACGTLAGTVQNRTNTL